ncbi:MAG: pyridoxal-phosphate dependent enzyme [Acidobacteria bacterium]|nr:MAG: pyridoxal-phosphate dependent enzyme [Acidobacteriota bacterium]REK00265.1 MAG: pyridoxal-phosphate dependent enzyme [Acidobacteriota bacterium]
MPSNSSSRNGARSGAGGGAPSLASLARAAWRALPRIADRIRRTPIERSAWLSEEVGCEVYFKLENHQLTGSFKLRGATNKAILIGLQGGGERLVGASTGNHGLALATAGRQGGSAVTIHAPSTAEPRKLEAIRRAGAEVVVSGDDCVEAEVAARRAADESGAVYVSPYNDLEVVAGQGTLAVELVEQLPEVGTVYLALGGGGLCGGVGAVLAEHARRRGSEVELVACSPAASAVMLRSLAAGAILELESAPTLSDGTAGGVESGAVTFELCRRTVTRGIEVEEDAIAAALRDVIAEHHTLVEGAAAAAVAGLRADVAARGRPAGPAVVVLCGGNVSLDVLRRVL